MSRGRLKSKSHFERTPRILVTSQLPDDQKHSSQKNHFDQNQDFPNLYCNLPPGNVEHSFHRQCDKTCPWFQLQPCSQIYKNAQLQKQCDHHYLPFQNLLEICQRNPRISQKRQKDPNPQCHSSAAITSQKEYFFQLQRDYPSLSDLNIKRNTVLNNPQKHQRHNENTSFPKKRDRVLLALEGCQQYLVQLNFVHLFVVLIFLGELIPGGLALTQPDSPDTANKYLDQDTLLGDLSCWRGGFRCDLAQVLKLPATNSSPNYKLSGTFIPTPSQAQNFHKTPQYVFEAFGHMFHLVLHRDNQFLVPDIKFLKLQQNKINASSIMQSSQSSPHYKWTDPESKWTDQESSWLHTGAGCFYSGYVRGDVGSRAALSLCGGLSGHVTTSTGSFFVSPETNSSLHRIYRTSQPPPLNKIITKESSRQRRSLETPSSWPPQARENWIEVMVVVDGSMVKYHGDGVRHYVLTLMHIVSLIYRDASLGNRVHIAVAKLLVLKEHETFAPKKKTRINASEMLKAFCKWQTRLNQFTERGPVYFDVALLLTRVNICRNPLSPGENCDTLGLAELGTMCHEFSCAIVQDNGLSAAFTIAHELGHVANMPHDDDQKCKEFQIKKSATFVMSRTLDHNTNPWEWSRCSRHFITTFIDKGYGHCLSNRPKRNYLDNQTKKISKLAGEFFDASAQCELVFGQGSRVCSYMPSCRRLWCTTPEGEQNGCKTQHMPWADGTECGEERWCIKSECVDKSLSTIKPVHGAWGGWRSWSECSRTCGGGIRKSYRDCSRPKPNYGGNYCVGNRLRYESCNVADCPAQSTDFRHEQCRAFNGNNFNIEEVPPWIKWTPKYTGLEPGDKCKLYCRVEYSSAYYLLSSSVVDGTPCGPDTYDKCVAGQCIPAGCDYVLGSTTKLDICGVCGGDNSTCVVEKGFYNKSSYGYNFVALIPTGASSIEIRQQGYRGHRKDDNYIALKDVDTGEYLLNGEFVVSMFQKTIQYSGTLLEYSGSDVVMERLNSTKPLRRDLVVEVLTVGNLFPPGISYTYLVSRADPPQKHKWKTLKKWTHCDKLCRGKKLSEPVCVRQGTSEVEVAEKECYYLRKPDTKKKDCNMHCHLEWKEVERGKCSSVCGKGKQDLVHQCIRVMNNQLTVTVLEKYCQQELKAPPNSADCDGECEGLQWNYGLWSKCDKTCGNGIQLRNARCIDKSGNVLPDEACSGIGKMTTQQCGGDCAEWKVGDWSMCNSSCGTGVRQRPYWCQMGGRSVGGENCRHEDIPEHRGKCTSTPCVSWTVGKWSGCSAVCGPGKRTREVICRDSEIGEQIEDEMCEDLRKPDEESTCIELECPNVESNAIEVEVDRTEVDVDMVETSHEKEDKTMNVHVSKKKVLPSPVSNRNTRILPPSGKRIKVPRYRWKVGPWEQCSESCGGGEQSRPVACFDSRSGEVELDKWKCSRIRPRPVQVRLCNEDKCPRGEWIVGNWNTCSVSCGKGIRQRSVHCVSSVDGQLIGDHYCLLSRPLVEEVCQNNPCENVVPQIWVPTDTRVPADSDPDWKTGGWGQCSSTCGGGFKQRHVVCQSSNGEVRDLCQEKKPKQTTACNSGPCPQWNFGGWSKCSKSCGNGHQDRLVRCQDHLGQNLPDHQCHLESRPVDSQVCSTQVCHPRRKNKFAWKVLRWSPCSQSCGRGLKIRGVDCVNLSGDGSKVDDSNCGSRRKPTAKKTCNKFTCPFKWIPGEWSQCSHSCGRGLQHRKVSCHRVNKYNWVDPDISAVGCNTNEKPTDIRHCSIANCQDKVSWFASSWSQCTWKACGKRGKQKRGIYCLDQEGRKIKKKLCKQSLPKALKPKKKRRCEKKLCGYESCLDLKQRTGIILDGEQLLLVAGRNLSIYCHDLHTNSPREYLTLHTGEKENYSEIYGKRLMTPNSCPNNGTRTDNCDCVTDTEHGSREGLSVWNKIKLNISSLSVNTHDFTFSRQLHGEVVPYGEAGDCYSTANCPQGKFSINLSGTGLRVSPYTGWVGMGNTPSLWLQRIKENQIIYGKCGGYCGTCVPQVHTGLKLDLLIP